MSPCWRCGGTMLANWEQPSCLQCGAGEPPRAPGPDDAKYDGPMRSTRTYQWANCGDCGEQVAAYGMGSHRARRHTTTTGGRS